MTLPNELHPGFFSAGGSSGDLGDTIEQSLRNTGSGQFYRNSFPIPSQWTASFWFKNGFGYSSTGAGGYAFSWHFGSTSYVICGLGIGHPASYTGSSSNGNCLVVCVNGLSTWADINTNFQIRDPSAWYHHTIVSNAGTLTWYVNGVNIGNVTGVKTSGTSTNFTIGGQAQSSGIKGYFADFHYIDGTNYAPTDFARTNEDGVWVPKTAAGITYGSNGFYLKFDSSGYNGSGGIGADHSGNGNDFTTSGYDTGDVRLYSKDLYSMTTGSGNWTTTTSKNWSSNTPPTGFNGSTSDAVQVTTGDTWVWRPSYSLTATLVEVYPTNSSPNQKLYFNGTEVGGTYTGAAWNTVYTGSATTVNHIGGEFTGGGNGFYAIRVNGTILVDNTDNDVDYLDTPTSNYGTFNAVNKFIQNGLATLDRGNLRLSALSADYIDARSAIAASDKDCYCEMSVTELGSSLAGIGVGTSNAQISSGIGSYITYREAGSIVQYPGNTTLGTVASYTDGDIIGMTISSTQVAFYKNGTLQGTYTHNYTGDFFVIGMAYYTSGNSVLDFNFGQMPFIYTPPTGYSALQTNNLPAPTIKDGKEHFGAVTYAGTGSQQSITGLEFQPDLVWMKERGSLSESHILMDSVRGTNSTLRSNTSGNEVVSSNYFTSFDANGFTVNTDSGTNDASGTYVAWCWKAGGTAVSNGNGTITSSVSANTDAGFSIVSWTGTQTASQTVGHGLSEAPDFVIYKARDEAANWIVGSSAIGATEYLVLDVDNGATSNSTYIPSRPTNSVLNLGSVSSVNNDENMIAYCWHSVEGFSKFGSYNGGGSGTAPGYDGPFIYLGFKPSLLLIKRSNAGGDPWILLDSTRDTHNFAFRAMRPNTNNGEISSGDQYAIDFLSNGFKCRSNNAAINNSTSTYVYAAFAESPFGGENVPPATAR